jgi:aminoglycoside phosphotransferase (APT) family kinase protein
MSSSSPLVNTGDILDDSIKQRRLGKGVLFATRLGNRMELQELEKRLGPFCQAMYADKSARVSNVYNMPGHAGFSYGYTVDSGDLSEEWYIRLPPPNVNWKGTADVLRQVEVLNALDGSPVPHCSVKWSGDDLQWFERPYFVVPKLEGDVANPTADGWVAALPGETRRFMAEQAMTAMAEVHKIDWKTKTPYLGDPVSFEDDVTRWDRFYEKSAEPQRLRRTPEVREALLKGIPKETPIGVFHGDLQWSNIFYSMNGTLLAVIDWELVGIGATLNDVGWMATFNDKDAWPSGRAADIMPNADDLIEMYAKAYDGDLPSLNWYRALAAYKFAIITGFNLYLHRSGKRTDDKWERIGPAAETLMDRAAELLRTQRD